MFNVLVKLLVCPRSLCSVEVAASNDVTVGCVKVEGVCNILEIAKGEVLQAEKVSTNDMKPGDSPV